ncbi:MULTISPECIES: bifunctional methylenetetrahydrofolate dehydrogenase/methenyltetrahydrofolate cyclohydrolase FolD [Cobetia]|uniref:Bifunctional protein FolD n=1 Tax=Cobetia crustatorum TaxID=553385 RepID=A0A558HLV5_9GAMM|nr:MULTISPECIES: bifunctional methylenetetrahydrofolate dehydrogenase/methenyltetrahydrofolate cyclohydrolase FolD [Cobetia]TVU70124.1 bifunctional methylenetetrahydrofolate dehydrogenase/methenyltetrahydrofolate cyclohydrolase FolD [Cobetia crustatorum]
MNTPTAPAATFQETAHQQTARLIDGKAASIRLLTEVTAGVATLAAQGVTPGLAVVLVGDDPASGVYVRNKLKRTVECGMQSFEHRLPVQTTEAELLTLVAMLNASAEVHGILVQLPLPAHIEEAAVLEAIDPAKDVDGFHRMNVGALVQGADALAPCTPTGCMRLLRDTFTEQGGDLSGLHAVVIGRSNIVGKPMAILLLAANCTVTQLHSRSQNSADLCRQADIVVAAVGRPNMINAEWIKPGAVVIDVGINRIEQPAEDSPTGKARTRLVGDVDFDTVVSVAGAITPVPGGVGPMTIACLLANTLTAARRQSA